jgi:hypothetical protein
MVVATSHASFLWEDEGSSIRLKVPLGIKAVVLADKGAMRIPYENNSLQIY